MTTSPAPAGADRWTGRPGLARATRMTVLLVPFVIATATAFTLSMVVPTADGWVWGAVRLVVVAACATVVMRGLDRVLRRALPLASLLELTLVFPDRAPSRVAVAMRAASSTELDALLDRYQRSGAEGPARAAEYLLDLVAALSRHDHLTRGHSERVRAYAQMIGVELGLSGDDLDRLRWAGLIHDIGKLRIDAAILNKPGRLTDDEFAVITTHPDLGAELAAPLADWLGDSVLAVAQHHEKWDGTGYPRRLRGDEISRAARIVAVADVFDVITSIRSYKPARSPHEARAELARCAGTHFDPEVVRAFLNISLGRLRRVMGPLSWMVSVLTVSKPASASSSNTASTTTATTTTTTTSTASSTATASTTAASTTTASTAAASTASTAASTTTSTVLASAGAAGSAATSATTTAAAGAVATTAAAATAVTTSATASGVAAGLASFVAAASGSTAAAGATALAGLAATGLGVAAVPPASAAEPVRSSSPAVLVTGETGAAPGDPVVTTAAAVPPLSSATSGAPDAEGALATAGPTSTVAIPSATVAAQSGDTPAVAAAPTTTGGSISTVASTSPVSTAPVSTAPVSTAPVSTTPASTPVPSTPPASTPVPSTTPASTTLPTPPTTASPTTVPPTIATPPPAPPPPAVATPPVVAAPPVEAEPTPDSATSGVFVLGAPFAGDGTSRATWLLEAREARTQEVPNVDVDRDELPGLTLRRPGDGAGRSGEAGRGDEAAGAGRWARFALAPDRPVVVNGEMVAVLHLAVIAEDGSDHDVLGANVEVHVRRCAVKGEGCSVTHKARLEVQSKGEASHRGLPTEAFTPYKVALGSTALTLADGERLELWVAVAPDSKFDVVLAFDATATPSALMIS